MKKNTEKYTVVVDTEKVGQDIEKITKEISTRVIGQSRAISHILRFLASEKVGLRDPKRPIGVIFLAGPSGCGKTLTAKETARAFLGISKETDYPLTNIQCSTLFDKYQMSSLIGSSAGYIGYGDLPALHWINIEKHHLLIKLEKEIDDCRNPEKKIKLEKLLSWVKQTINLVSFNDRDGETIKSRALLKQCFDSRRPLKSIVLFDEIEEAHPNFSNLLLGILEDGELRLANGEITNFRNSFIVMTTNTGSREIQKLMEGKIGFTVPTKNNLGEQEKLDQAIYEEAKRAIEKIFPTKFISRLGKEIIVFRTLDRDNYFKILEIFLSEIQSRLSGKNTCPPPILINYTQLFKEFLIDQSTSQKYGARILRDVVKKYVMDPISFAFSSGELIAGDAILFDLEDGKSVMRRQRRAKNQISNTALLQIN